MTNLEEIKQHGAMLALEAELNTRITTLRNAQEKRNWVLVFSCATFICQLAEELRKLNDNVRTPQETPKTS